MQIKQLVYKAAGIGAAASMLFIAAAPAAAADLSISRNGARSSSRIVVSYDASGDTTQTNAGNTTTTATTVADTGDNRASFNTGGDVGIATGMATATTDVSNIGHLNEAGDDCGCPDDGELVAAIEENGADSENTIRYERTNDRGRTQGNTGNTTSTLNTTSRTGRNRSSFNTDGDVSVTTADGSATTTVDNLGHTNE